MVPGLLGQRSQRLFLGAGHTWVQPPSVGLLWTPGYWGWRDGIYVWSAGYWEPHIGFYGGVDYGFGYGGEFYLDRGLIGTIALVGGNLDPLELPKSL
jgi:hypothetical protein